MKAWMKFAAAGAVIVGVIAYLMITGLNEHSVYYLEVTELVSNPERYDAKGTRLSGDVVEGSIVKDNMNAKKLTFNIKDTQGATMAVEYRGVVPDAFTEGVTVILEGVYNPTEKLFTAKTLMAKCPSKYEGEDPTDHNAATASNDIKQ